MLYLWLLFLWKIIHLEINLVSACGSDITKTLLGGKYEFKDLTRSIDDDGKFGFDTKENNSSNRLHHWMNAAGRGTFIDTLSCEEHSMHVSHIPTEKLIVQLILIDVSSKVKDDPELILYMKDVNASINSDVLSHMSSWPSLVVFKFGWSNIYNEHSKKFAGYDSEESFNLPTLSTELARWFTTCESCKNIVGIGTDLPYLNARGNSSAAVPNTLAIAGLYIIEGLNLNTTLQSYKCTAIVSPMRIKESSAPTNIIAICPKESRKKHGDSNEVTNHNRVKRQLLHKLGKHVVGQLKHDTMSHEHSMCKHHKSKHHMTELIENSTDEEKGGKNVTSGNTDGNSPKEKPIIIEQSENKLPSVHESQNKIITGIGGIIKMKENLKDKLIDNISK